MARILSRYVGVSVKGVMEGHQQHLLQKPKLKRMIPGPLSSKTPLSSWVGSWVRISWGMSPGSIHLVPKKPPISKVNPNWNRTSIISLLPFSRTPYSRMQDFFVIHLLPDLWITIKAMIFQPLVLLEAAFTLVKWVILCGDWEKGTLQVSELDCWWIFFFSLSSHL